MIATLASLLLFAPPTRAKPFLDQVKQVPPQLEWDREIVSRRGGKVRIRIEAPAPFAVTLVAARTFLAIKKGDMKGFHREDVIFTKDIHANVYEGVRAVPPGSSWVMIQNQTSKPARVHLRCWAVPN